MYILAFYVSSSASKKIYIYIYLHGDLYPWDHLDNTTLVTLATKYHWPHDLHDLAERRSQIPKTIGHMIYMT